ncbi:MAG: Lrp/AsnC family transcriptional regulator [Pseudomonadota bacterium]
MKTYSLDKFDIDILNVLQTNSRLSWVDLAQRVNLSASACQRRTQALQNEGIIERFTLNVDVESIGFDVEAFVSVSIERQDQEFAMMFRERMLRLPEVQSCYMLSGSIDFMLRIISRSLREYGQFIQQEILNLPGVKDATSSIVLECIKRDHAVPPTPDSPVRR